MTEAEFSTQIIKKLQENYSVFPIETEETVPGFPDLLLEQHGNACTYATHAELKVEDENGFIEFKRSQLAFYKRHPEMTFRLYVLLSDMTSVRMIVGTKEILNEAVQSCSTRLNFLTVWEHAKHKGEFGLVKD